MGVVKYTGPVASFHCPTNAEIRSLKVHFSPKQEGTGDPSPENVRPIVGWDGVCVEQCRENLFPAASYTRTSNGVTFTYYPNGDIHIEGTATAACFLNVPTSMYFTITPGMYTLSGNVNNSNVNMYLVVSSSNGGDIKFSALTSTPVIKEITFTDSSTRVQVSVMKETTVNVTIHPKLERGSYTANTTTNYEFGVLGKNKFNAYDWQTDVQDIIIQDSNSLTVSTVAYIENHNSYDISSTKGTTRTLSFKTKTNSLSHENATVNLAVLSDDGTTVLTGRALNLVEKDYETEYIIIIPPEGDTLKFRNWGWNGSLTLSDIQLELGSTATTYEPYDPKHTVYGGWVDLISGEVCEEYYKWIITPDNFTLNNVYTGGICFEKRLDTMPSPNGVMTEQKFTHGTIINPYSRNTGCNAFAYSAGGHKVRIGFSDSYNLSSVEDFYNWLNLQTDEVAVTYKTNFPNTYQLHSSELSTFLGQNNVWSNADYVEVEYDLHETQDILARKQFIMANEPHIEAPTPAVLQSFTTDMVAPLKECKVYFEPVQEGEGDPGPENVRNIRGWNNININQTGKNLIDTAALTGTSSVWWYGNIVTGYPNHCVTPKIPVCAGATYTLNRNSAQQGYVVLFDYNGQYINQIVQDTYTPTRTYGNDVYYIGITIGTEYLTDPYPQLELGSQQTSYEPYNGQTISLNWENNQGTIYGGYVDLVTGEVVKTYNEFIIGGGNSLTIAADSYCGDNGTDVFAYIPNDSGIANYTDITSTNLFCDQFKLVGYGIWSNPDSNIGKATLNARTQFHMVFDNIIVGISSSDSAADRKTKISAYLANNNVKVIYALTTPVHYSLSTTTLKTLRGTNNIWSNSNGNITVQFWTH